MIEIQPYDPAHFDGVDRLWREVFPNDPPRNQAGSAIPVKLSLKDGLFWVAIEREDAVVGTIMAGWDGHRGWLYSVAVDPHKQRAGIGRQLVEHAVQELRRRGCGKVNLQIRAGNDAVEAFYAKLGFQTEARISMGREV
ncbi:GNAT family acetyltransferase [uncultured Erythrobacter sp.]|uniref:GNAT family acetyltransferase n=1 Tax=uncultured Erythrobacter sp. TaxID=263913 RepID=UPI00260CBFA8|nr:GNAT family acetyltransferase [uncultured Erythrobacter sp.]